MVLAVLLESNVITSLAILKHGRHKSLTDSTGADKAVALFRQLVHHGADGELRFVKRARKHKSTQLQWKHL